MKKNRCVSPLSDFEAASVALFKRLVAERLVCRLIERGLRQGGGGSGGWPLAAAVARIGDSPGAAPALLATSARSAEGGRILLEPGRG